jgi:hypothetical protein
VVLVVAVVVVVVLVRVPLTFVLDGVVETTRPGAPRYPRPAGATTTSRIWIAVGTPPVYTNVSSAPSIGTTSDTSTPFTTADQRTFDPGGTSGART